MSLRFRILLKNFAAIMMKSASCPMRGLRSKSPAKVVKQIVTFIVLISLVVAAPDSLRRQSWDFEEIEHGQLPDRFLSEVGYWEVISDDDNQVLAQRAENRDAVLNVLLIGETSYKNVDLTVRIKPVAGENEGGGGLIWRAKDKDNYYGINYNPFVSRQKRRKPRICLYKVEDGKRTQLDHADVDGEVISDIVGEAPRETEWHTLRVTMHGTEMVGYLDGEKLLEAEDSTFLDVGKAGLWTKSDARTYFDDLTVSTFRKPKASR